MKVSLPISMNIDQSFYQGEWRNEHYVTPVMKKVWAVELDLLNQFINFCNEYNITYYAAFGTLLGAVRHGGFIPWDDDIDVVVSRKDYNIIEKYAQTYFKTPYFFQTERTDPGFSRHFARLRNSLTTAITAEEADCNLKINQGIWIDIFPMDNIPDNSIDRAKWIDSLNQLHTKMWKFSRYTLRYQVASTNENPIKRMRVVICPLIKLICEKCHIKNPFFERYEHLSKKYNSQNTRLIGVPWFKQAKERNYWDRNWFNQTKMIEFENILVTIPESYDSILTHVYHDWHQLVKGGATHQTTLFDPENCYLRYINNPDKLKNKIAFEENASMQS